MTLAVCETISRNEADEQRIEALYDILPEDGATLLLLSRDGQIRSELPDDNFSLHHLSGLQWQDIVMRLDDGDDPVITGSSECVMVVTELPRPLGQWSYSAVVLPQRSVDLVLQNFDLIQMILGQIRLYCLSAA